MKKIIFGLALALVLASASSASAYTYTRDLTIGASGADVVALQDMLSAGGYLVMPAGVSKGYYGALTQSAVAKWQAAVGIAPAAGYFGPMSRAKASAGTTTTTTTTTTTSGLSGGDGDIQSVTETNSGTETTLGEGKTEDVLGFDLEADDNSDLSVSSVKVQIVTASGKSTRLTRYLDSVAIMVDGDEVGSVDASDFSRDGDTSTATISLDDVVVEAGEEVRFYVSATAKDSVDADELDGSLTVSLERVRVEDANGAVLTDDITGTISSVVTFEDAAENDDARVKSSTDTRDAGLLKVDANTKSDDFDVLTFKFDIDEDSSDLSVLEIPVEFTIDNASTTAFDIEDFIQDMWIEVDGEKYDDYAWTTSGTIGASAEVATATISIDEGDLEIASGDVVEAVVYVVLAQQDGNYDEGTTLAASVRGSEIVAENPEGDTFNVDGTVNGETQTAQISAATVEGFTWAVNNTGTIVDFFFTVTAEDEDYDVLSASIASSTAGTATTSAGVLSKSTGDADSISGGFTVLDGDTATFRVRYTLSGTNGTYKEVTITSVAGQEVPDNKQVSPTATLNVQS